MQLTDTHCHIHSADYPLPLIDVDAHCVENDVAYLLCVGTDADDSERAVQFARGRSNTWASLGQHPHEAKLGVEPLKKLRALLEKDLVSVSRRSAPSAPPTSSSSKIVALGECGLDYFYGHSSKLDQEKALRYQIELALEYDLPLIFHVREAFEDFWPIFDSYSGIRGVLHSYTDNQRNLELALSRDLSIGVNGIVTFTKNDWQLEVAKAIPLEKIVLETDAPFLTPTPNRGKVNEPANVLLTARFLSELRHVSVAQIANQTTANARQLFSF